MKAKIEKDWLFLYPENSIDNSCLEKIACVLNDSTLSITDSVISKLKIPVSHMIQILVKATIGK